ncbi:B-cell receptor CD22-like isoform X1 [Pyxicephalus adspersus]|uniref:B-cell receptor CD22-like isoform X1 n=1 Tax=Pyxicephalus adspersus TaxID=30357 RepID=UPI003B5C164D
MGTGWSVKIPRQIRALSGDCVVIPCWFTLPASERHQMKAIMWYQVETQHVIFNSNYDRGMIKASLVDNLQVGNCSLWIRDITKTDSMMYRFLIELKGVKNYTSPSSVDLRVSDVPVPPEFQISTKNIMEGDTVIMTCRINHTCNMRPLSFIWNPVLGEISARAEDLEDGIWKFSSTQIFIASASHQGITVNCQTKHMKSQKSSKSKNYKLIVWYSPKNTTVTVSASEIREGGNVSLWCSSQSNPEVSQYIWNGLLDDGTLIPLVGNQTTILISNITASMRSVYCTAQNSVGIQTSPVVELNVTYKPQITPRSYCRPTFNVMKCTCIVKSNPPPIVIWHVLNFSMTETEGEYEVNNTFSNHVSKTQIRGPSSAMTNVSCYSENKEGAIELLLPVYWDITKLLVIAGAVGIGVLLLFIIILKVLLSSRKNTLEKNKTDHFYLKNNQYGCQPHSLYGNMESHSLYGNTESHSFYGNSDSYSLYGNTEIGINAPHQEMLHSAVPNDFYSVYECPNSFEEESVYANT